MKILNSYILVTIFIVICSISVYGQCPAVVPNEIDSVKLQKVTTNELKFLINSLRILVDPEEDVVNKAVVKKLLLRRFFKNQSLNPVKPAWFAYQLELEPKRELLLKPIGFEAYLDYLSNRRSDYEKVDIKWCFDEDEIKNIIKFQKTRYKPNVLNGNKNNYTDNNGNPCKYILLEAVVPISELFKIKSYDYISEGHLCKQFFYKARAKLVDDSLGFEKRLEWIPYIEKVDNNVINRNGRYVSDGKANACVDSKLTNNCIDILYNEIDTHFVARDLPPIIFSNDKKNGFENIPGKKLWEINKKEYGYIYGFLDTNRVSNVVSKCSLADTSGLKCDQTPYSDYVIVNPNNDFIISGISNDEYIVDVYTGDVDPNIELGKVTIIVGNKKIPNIKIPRGEVKKVSFTVKAENNKLKIRFEGGSNNHLNAIVARRNHHRYDFGKENLVQNDFKSVSLNSIYLEEIGYGFDQEEFTRINILQKTINPNDSLFGDFLEIPQPIKFYLNIPKGSYNFNLLVDSTASVLYQMGKKKYKSPFNQKVRVDKSNFLKVYFTPYNENLKIYGMVFEKRRFGELNIPWHRYLVPGLALDYIEDKKIPIWTIPLSAGFSYTLFKAFSHENKSSDYYQMHIDSKIISDKAMFFKMAQEERKNAKIYTGSAMLILIGSGVYAFVKDLKNKKKDSFDERKEENISKPKINPIGVISPKVGSASLGVKITVPLNQKNKDETHKKNIYYFNTKLFPLFGM